MASATYTQTYADNTTQTVKRSIKQGRKPQGFTRWNGRLKTESLDALREEATRLHPYYTVNDLVRIAVDNYVCTELLKH
jgi:hypothetical protein